MATMFFVQHEQGDFGPLSFQAVALMIAGGTLTEDSMVRRTSDVEFIPVREVIGLLPSSERLRKNVHPYATESNKLRLHTERSAGIAFVDLPPIDTFDFERILRMGVCLFVANVSAFLLSRWSLRESQRFPHGGDLNSGGRFVPFVGECGQTAFVAYVIGLMLVTATVVWFLLVWLKQRGIRRIA